MWHAAFKAFFRIRPKSIPSLASDNSSSFRVANKLEEIQTLLKADSEHACEKTGTILQKA
jgi:hypothetical protein